MKQMISLLVLFFAFAKYGEPKAMLMSLQGDVNLVMLETSVSTLDTIGFMYDDQFGGFAINPSYCPLWRRAPTSFVVTQDCIVRPHTAFTETPSDEHYRASYNPNYPSRGSGTNLIIGHRGPTSEAVKTVVKNEEAFEFPDIERRISRRHSRVYCNDKDYTHYKNLLKPGNKDHAVILFGRSNINRYEKLMKCIAVLKTPRDDLHAARLFMVALTDLEYEPFTFHTSSLSEHGAIEGAPSNQLSFNAISNTHGAIIETNFVFRSDASTDCPPTVTMRRTSDNKLGIFFHYGDRTQTMPAIEAADSQQCGIAVAQSANGGEPTFHYWCECIV